MNNKNSTSDIFWCSVIPLAVFFSTGTWKDEHWVQRAGVQNLPSVQVTLANI